MKNLRTFATRKSQPPSAMALFRGALAWLAALGIIRLLIPGQTVDTDYVTGVIHGQTSHVFDGSHNAVAVNVTFTVPFGAAPIVVASAETALFACAVTAVSATGFTISCWYTPTGNAAAATVVCAWIAKAAPGS